MYVPRLRNSSCCLREVGPSASSHGEEPELAEPYPGEFTEKANQLIDVVTQLQKLAADPRIHEICSWIGATDILEAVKPMDAEVAKARRGEPTSSRPGTPNQNQVKEEKGPKNPPNKTLIEKTSETKVDKTQLKEEKVKKEEEKPNQVEPDQTPQELCNSSTHRKEHARLTRRMASLDANTYPEMVRLWNGNRQDRFLQRATSSKKINH